MNKENRLVGVLALALLSIVLVTSAHAQEKASDNTQIVLEKLRADKKLLVAENMKLDEAETKRFWPVYDRFQDELFLLRARTARMLQEYADVYEKMDNANARKLLKEYMDIEAVRLKLYQTYLPRFQKVLPDTKVARYYQIENKFQAILMNELAANIPLVKAVP